MSVPSMSRRRLLQAAGAAAVASAVTPIVDDPPAAAALPPARPDGGVSAFPSGLDQVRLTASRWLDNQNRTLSCLRSKLTREPWLLDPGRVAYFDFYERALLNHLIGAQSPADGRGHVTYFTPLNPGGRRGVGPAWGGGTWSKVSTCIST